MASSSRSLAPQGLTETWLNNSNMNCFALNECEYLGSNRTTKRETQNMLVQEMLGVLVMLVLCFNVDADKDIHRYFFTVNGTRTVSVLLIDYSMCTNPGMKLSYYPDSSKTDGVGELVYNELYLPYKFVRSNTKKFGINNITTERNDSFLMVRFIGISALANGGVFSIHQICGVTQLVHENEYWFKFLLDSLPATIQQLYPTTATSTSASSTTATEKPTEGVGTKITTGTNSTQKAGNETGAENWIWIGVIIAGILLLLLIVGLFDLLCVNRDARFSARNEETQLNKRLSKDEV